MRQRPPFGWIRRPWVRRSLAGVVAVIVLALLATLFVRLESPPHQQARRGGPVTPRASATAPAATPTPALMPGTLLIPKIRVIAPIEEVTVDSNNDMAPPRKPTDVGWYSPGVVPGQPGDAVIDGHLDWYGVPHAVFYYLNQLRPGDEVDVVNQNGVKLRFKVTDSVLVGASARPAGLFDTTGTPRLTLITCAGDWNQAAGQYNQRLLVDASYAGTG